MNDIIQFLFSYIVATFISVVVTTWKVPTLSKMAEGLVSCFK